MSRPSGNRGLGRAGEDLAAEALRSRGYRILERNYRCPLGEIDCVALHRGTVVFLEVKTRSGPAYGPPHEAVDRRKRRKLTRLAQYFVRERRLEGVPLRFDVVAVVWDGPAPRVEVFENAFEADEG